MLGHSLNCIFKISSGRKSRCTTGSTAWIKPGWLENQTFCCAFVKAKCLMPTFKTGVKRSIVRTVFTKFS